jgi:hypothetical protein
MRELLNNISSRTKALVQEKNFMDSILNTYSLSPVPYPLKHIFRSAS